MAIFNSYVSLPEGNPKKNESHGPLASMIHILEIHGDLPNLSVANW